MDNVRQETINEFLTVLANDVQYCLDQEHLSEHEKLNLLVFSFLTYVDGCSLHEPPLQLRSLGSGWFSGNIGGALHSEWYRYAPRWRRALRIRTGFSEGAK